MGRKRKHAAVVERPIFCFYCDRTFADETTLIVHQKGKHFKCTECSKRLNSVGGCAIHLLQVHRIEIKAVPNAKEDRGGLEWEIFGMAGVPDGMVPGGPVPEDDTASKAQKIADEQSGPGQAGAQAAPGQYYPPVSGGHAGSIPYPMMPPPHDFPLMPPGSYGMHPPGMPPPFMYRPPPPLYSSDLHPPTSVQPPHPATSNPASGMPPGSMPPGIMPPGSTGLGGMPGSSGVPGLQPHTSGPLFPLDLPKAEAVAAAAPPGTSAPGEAAVVEPTLIWKDDRFSMEERRAQMIQSRTPPPPLRPTSFAAAPSLRQAAQAQPPHQLPYEQPRQPTYQMPTQQQQLQQQRRQQQQRDEMFVPQQPTRY